MKVSHVFVKFGMLEVLKDFSIEFPDKGCICIFGPSGCGKSTLLHVICGLVKPDSGCIKNEKKKIAYVFQEDRLVPWLTVEQNVRIVNENELCGELLQVLQVDASKNKMPHELSGGMRRRVALARALHYDGDIVLLDEPFKGLDLQLKKDIISYIVPLIENKLVILVTHDRSEAELMSNCIYFVDGLPLSVQKVALNKENALGS